MELKKQFLEEYQKFYISNLIYLTSKMVLVDIKTSTITEKGQIVIPKELRIEHFMEGSKVAILSFEDHIEIRPLKELDENLYSMYASQDSLSEHWKNKKEAKAWKNL